MGTKSCVIRRTLWINAVVGFGLLFNTFAQAQSPMSQGRTGRAELDARLVEAARNPSLSDWQRGYMNSLAGVVADPGPCADPWTLVSPSGTLPSVRIGHTAVYDSKRNRMIVFGGILEWTHQLNDTWALSLDTMTWEELHPLGEPPTPVQQHVTVYDALRDRMLVWGGGNDTHTLYDSTWALSLGDPPTWTMLTTRLAPPAKRFVAAAIYDPVRDRMIVFGGDRGTGAPGSCFNDTWALSLGSQTWAQLSPTGTLPAPRGYVSGIYDPVRDRMVVYGGHDYPSTGFDDSWALSLATEAWEQLSPTGEVPAARWYNSTIYDPREDAMVVFGGGNLSGPLNETWVLDLASPAWSRARVSGTLPSERAGQTAIYDPLLKRMVVFGGASNAGRLNETWTLGLRSFGIRTVSDVRNDQGRSVRINFFAADGDTAGAPAPIMQYEAYRRIDRLPVPALALSMPLSSTPISRPSVTMAGWEFVGAIPAHGECEYNMIVPTLADSNVSGIAWSAFFIRAATANPTVFFDSDSDSGYSVDNLAPVVPVAFASHTVTGGIHLGWAMNREPDLAGYRVYRGFAADFVPGPGNLIASPVDTNCTDPEVWAQVYYKLSAVDINGNESGFTMVAKAPVLAAPGDAPPNGVWLGRATPNPMRDGCTIRFGLPQAASVSLVVLDLQGRRVRVLVDGSLPAGDHAARWDGRTASGATAPAGVYLYRFQTAGQSLSGRIVRVE